MLVEHETRRGLGGNPYFVFGPRRFREARRRAYHVREHRRGRALSAILEDPYIRRCGCESLLWHVLEDPRTIEALERDVCDAITGCAPSSAGPRRP
jgi:hypothetical protein